MSIKIYDGFRVNVKDSGELFSRISELRKKTYKFYQELVDKSVKKDFFRKNGAFDNWRKFQEFIKENLNGSMVFYFDGETNSWYATAHACGQILSIIKEEKWLKDFCYYNNTDWPEGMTETEWYDRRDVWDRVLLENGAGIPSESGLILELMPTYLPWPSELSPKEIE